MVNNPLAKMLNPNLRCTVGGTTDDGTCYDGQDTEVVLIVTVELKLRVKLVRVCTKHRTRLNQSMLTKKMNCY